MGRAIPRNLEGRRGVIREAPKNNKSPSLSAGASDITGQLPTLPHTCACSTIGAEGLNCRVRDGNGWVPLARVTQNRCKPLYHRGPRTRSLNIDGTYHFARIHFVPTVNFMVKPNGQLVTVS